MMISLNGLLLVTIVTVSGLTHFTAVQSLRERARQDALGTASFWSSVAGSTMTSTADAGDRPAPKLDVQRLLRSSIDAGNVKAVFIVKPDAQLHSPAGSAAAKEYYESSMDIVAVKTIKTLTPTTRFRGGWLEACVPLAGFGGKAGALICKLDTHQLDEAIDASLRDIAVLSVAGLIAGALLSSFLARKIADPIRQLSEATRLIGSGKFGHRVRITSDDEVGMLAGAFNRMADSLEANTERLALTMAEKEALRREMDIAAEIQRSLLPEACPHIDGFDLAARATPAGEVGGDFYDFIPLPDDRWGLVIADVSGKGVPAALLMALSRSLIRSYSRERPSILEALHAANSFVIEDTRSEMFVTCFYAVIDPNSRTLTYVNAGHNPAVINRADAHVRMLPATGTPLGVLDEPGFSEETCPLEPGDVVIMYTDGITEAVNAQGEQFGVARLQEVLKNSAQLPADKIVQRTMTAVETFASGQAQFDDMTIVLFRVQ